MKNRKLCQIVFLLICILHLSSCNTNSSKATPEDLYYFAKLDSALNQAESNRKVFDNQVAILLQKCQNTQSNNATYFYQKMLAEAFIEMNPDSALTFIQKNLQLAKQLNKKDWEVESYIYQAQTYNSSGLLEDARKALDTAHTFPMQKETKLNYFVEEINYWRYKAIMLNTPQPAPNSVVYADSILNLVKDTDSPYYMYAKTWNLTDENQKKDFQKEIMAYADAMDPENIWYIRITECAGTMAFANNDIHNQIKYFTLNLISKFNKVSRHLPTIVNVGSLARDLGELSYTSKFYNSAILIQTDHPEHAFSGPGFGRSIMKFHEIMEERLETENKRNQIENYILLALSLLSIGLLIYVIIDLRKRIELHKKLEKSHKELILTESNLRELNNNLSKKEKEINEVNNLLTEANYLKEEYIGQLFATCSEYLEKMDKLKMSISRKLKAGQYEEALKQTSAKEVRDNSELHELWARFDEVFLNLFPDFLEQFNELLRPEERITLHAREKLNTDLRIYALVRLGINNSVKIGKILGISTQTVYNARMKMRSKAIESEVEFPVKVRQLQGKKPPVEDYVNPDESL